MAEDVWRVSETGIEDFERFVEHALRESVSMEQPLRDSRDWVQFMIFDQFVSDGLRSGGWEPLSQQYDLWKIGHSQYEMLRLAPEFLHGYRGTPEDEEMRDVLLSDDAWEITDTDAIFSPDSTRAGWHQEGIPDRRTFSLEKAVERGVRLRPGKLGGFANPLPARPWLAFLETDYETIEGYFEEWMQDDVLNG